jgi:hypothetical protein
MTESSDRGFAQHFARYLTDALGEHLADSWEAPPSSEQLLIPRKMAVQVPISNELLMDYGVIPDTRPPPPPLPWRMRLRWKWSGARDWLAERAYRLISGRDMPGGDD